MKKALIAGLLLGLSTASFACSRAVAIMSILAPITDLTLAQLIARNCLLLDNARRPNSEEASALAFVTFTVSSTCNFVGMAGKNYKGVLAF